MVDKNFEMEPFGGNHSTASGYLDHNIRFDFLYHIRNTLNCVLFLFLFCVDQPFVPRETFYSKYF